MDMRIYIHWPFCLRRCPYCDFTSRVASHQVQEEYFYCLLREAELWARSPLSTGKQVESFYIGGGTPSVLPPARVGTLLSRVQDIFPVKEDAEVTVEVNPGTWTGEELREVAGHGVNRLSLGLQSLDDTVLRLLGRIHGARECHELLWEAMGIEGVTVSVDLLYGLPRECKDSFLRSLVEVLAYRPHHVSIYPLSLSPGVPMARKVEQGLTELPGEDEVAAEYEAAVELLRRHGYRRYEISNFSLPGRECHHNLGYWRREEYLGLGASAHSFIGGVRWKNVDSVIHYVSSIRKGAAPVVEAHPLLPWEDESETVMLGLRLAEGIEVTLLKDAMEMVEELRDLGLLEESEGRISLTTRGMLLQNEVLAKLLPA